MKWFRAFVLFWYDFIVGDSMTLAAGTLGALSLGAVIAPVKDASIALEVLLPAAIVTTLIASLVRR